MLNACVRVYDLVPFKDNVHISVRFLPALEVKLVKEKTRERGTDATFIGDPRYERRWRTSS